ncbi:MULTISPECIES: hypothetical protein [unclassified Streptomyces]|uniref:hypothetical protein n=1 Tax=unclassified Streptomyces TaxID=2593676 RepID=UPI00381B3DBD
MTVHVSAPPASGPARPGRPRAPRAGRLERGSSPHEGERLRPLTRGQVEDRLRELGDLYAECCGGGSRAWNEARTGFLRHLAADARRPGFSLLIAESTTLTGFAYGFPAGRHFVVSGIVVPPRVRHAYQDRTWNLARRLSRRLIGDHGSVLGVTLVDVRDDETVRVLRAWGWRSAGKGVLPELPPGPYRVLVLPPDA